MVEEEIFLVHKALVSPPSALPALHVGLVPLSFDSIPVPSLCRGGFQLTQTYTAPFRGCRVPTHSKVTSNR